MRSNRALAGLMLAVVVLGLTAAVSAQVWGARETKFDDPVRVQGQLLPVGNYTVKHVMDGQKHVMVFKQASGQKQEFRVTCNIVKLNNRAKHTTKVYDTSTGTKVLKSMTFAGDNYEHVFGE